MTSESRASDGQLASSTAHTVATYTALPFEAGMLGTLEGATCDALLVELGITENEASNLIASGSFRMLARTARRPMQRVTASLRINDRKRREA